MKILVVEDESAIADFVQRGLEAEGYSVACAGDGNDGERQALAGDVDLVVLDLMLPGMDGLSVLDSIRHSKPGLPVIVLTARDTVEDKVAGLDGGAVDYVTKPFSFDELTARIRAHLREPAHNGEQTTLAAAGIHIDLLSREVTLGNEPVHLSAREFDLLAYFMRHVDEVLSREQILSAVWGYDFDPGTNVVEVYVGYLRRKLAGSDTPARIETLRSVGYRLTDR
ncbi:MAG: two-component system, OmpR family, copper resistance phosphate regulon response regulator CusR [Thermoleophilaceae bacterium]|jgi:DNA-binding response OmpR family regulator|nr:two-component system, OmpR family, copper resistance phosphate regulon response regulator CusR [Thermoleophilaceae bacterium]MEA2458612.1 two-component system, OmpR family, copper resistance phosphate regulon response regulator CusR [Thermoleophilaceae bacterium]